MVSYDEKYEFYANGALTVRAVYVENSVTVERAGAGDERTGGRGRNKLAYFAEQDVPAEWGDIGSRDPVGAERSVGSSEAQAW